MSKEGGSPLAKVVLLVAVALVLGGLMWFGGGTVTHWLRSLHGH